MGRETYSSLFFISVHERKWAMYFRGFNYWLTKHGRARFIERLGRMADRDILEMAARGVNGYKFIWAPDRNYPTTGRRLVTVLVDQKSCITLKGRR